MFKWSCITILLLSGVVTTLSLVSGFFLDDLDIAPFFAFRTELSHPEDRVIKTDPEEFGFDTIVCTTQKGGSGSGGVLVTIKTNGNKLIAVGGNETTFVGFKDVDGDGHRELLVTSPSSWSEKGMWKMKDGRFVKSEPNEKAKRILGFATFLMEKALFCVALSVLLFLLTSSALLYSWSIRKGRGGQTGDKVGD